MADPAGASRNDVEVTAPATPTGADYYPDYLLPVIRELEVKYEQFSKLREQVLLPHGYNTARAYWNDLDEWFRWAAERDKDVLDLSVKDVRQYLALLRRRKYSESTVRRRVTALRKVYELVHGTPNNAQLVVVGHRGARSESPGM